jgi:hypothetical protein
MQKLDRWLIPLVGVSLLVLALTRQTFWVLLAIAAVGVYHTGAELAQGYAPRPSRNVQAVIRRIIVLLG